jgi:hypothetical protein
VCSAVELSSWYCNNSLHDDQLFQSCKFLANCGVQSEKGERAVVDAVKSFGSVMALSAHPNQDIVYVAKRLMLCFPTGKSAQKGAVKSTAAITPEEQQQFTRRYMQLKREKDRSGKSKVLDLASAPPVPTPKRKAAAGASAASLATLRDDLPVARATCDGGCGKVGTALTSAHVLCVALRLVESHSCLLFRVCRDRI